MEHQNCQALEQPGETGKDVKGKIKLLEKTVLHENRWDTWHVGGVRCKTENAGDTSEK